MNVSKSRNPVEELAEEFVQRHRAGENPSPSEYAAQYPEWADEIEELFPALVMMEKFKPSAETTGGAGLDTGVHGKPVQSFGDYQILREIGRGGMGIVYEAEQVSLGRHVALKVLPARRFVDDVQIQRFHREAKAAGRLHHTNIVPVHGVGEHEGMPYYVMQLIPGMGLDRVLKDLQYLRENKHTGDTPPKSATDRRQLATESLGHALLTGTFAARGKLEMEQDANGKSRESSSASHSNVSSVHLPGQDDKSLSETGHAYWQSVARIGLQVADALAYAHEQGTLHRDIKPSNLLLDDHGTVWITDFGLAKALDDSDNVTQTGDVVGTLRYVAPERFSGGGDVRSDVYSLGLSLYELLTLRPAFDQNDRNQLVDAVMNGEPPRPRRINSAIPRDLETITLKAAAKNPGHRYQTCAELAADLRRYLEDKSIQARPAGSAELAWRWCRRNPAIAILLTTVALLLIAGTGVSTFFAIQAQNRLSDANIAKSKAIEAGEKAKQEAEKAKEVSKFLSELFQGSGLLDIAAGLGATSKRHKLTPKQLLDKGAARVEVELKDRPVVRAELLHSIGTAYLTLGHLKEAGPLLKKALALRRQHLPENHPSIFQTMFSFGTYQFALGFRTEALELLEKVDQFNAQRKGPDQADMVLGKYMLAWVLMEQHWGDVPKERVESLWREVMRIHASQKMPASRGLAYAHAALANLLQLRGKTAEAAAHLTKAKRVLADIGDDKTLTIFSLAMNARISEALGQRKFAHDLWQKTYQHAVDFLGPTHLIVYFIHVGLARYYDREGDLATTEAYHQRAADAIYKALGRQPRAARAMFDVAYVRVRQKKLDKQTEKLLRDALAIIKETGVNDPALDKSCRRLLVRLLDSTGRHGAAESIWQSTGAPKTDDKKPHQDRYDATLKLVSVGARGHYHWPGDPPYEMVANIIGVLGDKKHTKEFRQPFDGGTQYFDMSKDLFTWSNVSPGDQLRIHVWVRPSTATSDGGMGSGSLILRIPMIPDGQDQILYGKEGRVYLGGQHFWFFFALEVRRSENE